MNTTLYHRGVVRATGHIGATAILVGGDTVRWIGPEASVPDVEGQVVDLRGALVTPAFVDAHVHATAVGLALRGLDLSSTVSLAAALAALEQHACRHSGAPVLGHGWDDTRWPEQRPPIRQELDRASYGGVVYLSRIDSHTASLLHRYVDKTTRGELYREPSTMAEHIVACLEAGVQAGFHAIGDNALRVLINDCYDEAQILMDDRWAANGRCP